MPHQPPERQGTDLQVRPYKMDDEAKALIIHTYETTGSLTQAAAAAGVTLQTIRDHRRRDPQFHEEMKEAKAVHFDTVEQEILRRAVEGVDEPRFGRNGEVLGHVRKYSDDLLKFYARANSPKYRDKPQKVEATINDKRENIIDIEKLNDEQLAALELLVSKSEDEDTRED